MFTANPKSRIFLIIGPILSTALFAIGSFYDWPPEASLTLAITALCALWWSTEALPIPVTSLLPLALFPLLGVLSAKEVAEAYGNHFILLLLGGFLLSTALSHSHAHRRIALVLLNVFGGSSYRRVVFGFMATSALLSMWISNTATTLMLLPIALAIVSACDNQKLKIPLLLGICYAASIGGIGTPIGTPPNLLFINAYQQSTGKEFTFLSWMTWGIPLVIVFIPLVGLWLTRNLERGGSIELPETEAWSSAQIRILIIFAITALAWVTRREPFGGWSDWLGFEGANDASVVLLAVVALFLFRDKQGEPLLTWEAANRIPWGILLLFSSGLCIAEAFSSSGLAALFASALGGLDFLPLLLLIAMLCLGVTFLTELTSNTATTALLMPILATVGLTLGIDPYLLMIPAAMSASCAFMLPVATAPNAIIFGSEEVPIGRMIREGFALNFLGAALITGLFSVHLLFK